MEAPCTAQAGEAQDYAKGKLILSFNEFKRLLNATDGNLSVHARKLEDAKYVDCTKGFEGRTPKTSYKLTPTGRKALERYLDQMEALIRDLRKK